MFPFRRSISFEPCPGQRTEAQDADKLPTPWSLAARGEGRQAERQCGRGVWRCVLAFGLVSDEGAKTRPCALVAATRREGGRIVAHVVPVDPSPTYLLS